ncbi:MAG: RDD family protein [Stenotrophomonas sp.]|uniref:RDD family protein n=1 Tax=Stenotrophomonas sp. TaxID=69392 RepID=UPI003D6CF92A
MSTTADESARPSALLPRRLAALFYDFWPVLALWMLISAAFTLGYTFSGHATRENIQPYSALQWLLWLCCWAVAGLYATASWKRGGQTLGMRPWHLHLRSMSGGPASNAALWKRYAAGTLSLLCGGLGFWWALFDRERLTWHDRLSGTRLVKLPKPT